jgi:phosphoribosylanthranilate isomerase
MRTRVKFCGITNLEDALKAAELGVDAIGLNFCPASRRYLTPDQALQIITKLPPFITVVGVFVNASLEEITKILASVPLDRLQFHGDESPQFCESFHKAYYKAVRMRENINLDLIANNYKHAQAILVDTYIPNEQGGTGQIFDWKRLPASYSKPLILAGGLTPDNVFNAIQTVHPYAVDVASGIESIPGQKDSIKMTELMCEIKRADSF